MQNSWKSILVLAAAGSILGATAVDTCCAAAQQEKARPPVRDSRTFFLQKCSRCHEPQRGYDVIAERVLWKRTVAAMAVKDRAWMPPEAVTSIINYGTSYPVYVRTLFQERCAGCHSLEEVQRRPRSLAQWRTMVTYMAERREFGMTDEERALLAAGLSDGF